MNIRTIRPLIIVLYALGFQVCHAENRIQKLLELDVNLKIGMSKKEVQIFTGAPDNSDKEYIWMWTSKRLKYPRNWLDLYANSKIDKVYCLFNNGHLQSLILPAYKSDPWREFRKSNPGMSNQKAEELLGDFVYKSQK